MALHKDLTGAELHEPKGAATAANGTVYVANGSGSGAWTSRLEGVYNVNKDVMAGTIKDISTPNDKAYIYIPFTSQMTKLSIILSGPISTANAVLSIYINGVLFADTLTVPFAGSTAGQLHQVNIVTAHSIPADSVVEVRTNGASDTAAEARVFLSLTATG